MGANVRPAALHPRLAPKLAASVAALAVAGGAVAGGGGPPASSAVVSVSNGGCGAGWKLAGPGWHTFQVYNAAAEVDLVDPANGAIYAEVEALGPGTTSPMRLNIGSGSYAFRCLFEDAAAPPATRWTPTPSTPRPTSPATLPAR